MSGLATSLRLSLALLAGLTGCADVVSPPGDGQQITDLGPTDDAAAPDGTPFTPLTPPDLGLSPEPAGYPALTAVEVGVDGLPWLADEPELTAHRDLFLANTLERARWLTATFAGAEPGQPLPVTGELTSSVAGLLPRFSPQAHAGYVDALADVGAQGVVVELSAEAWAGEGRAALEVAIAQIGARGLSLQVRLGAEPPAGGEPQDFAAWQLKALTAAGELLAAAPGLGSPVGELRAPDPEALGLALLDGAPDPATWGGFLERLCQQAGAAGAGCAATLSFTASGSSPWLAAVLGSPVQRVGASWGRFDDLDGARLVALDLFLYALRTGGESGRPGRPDGVFLASAWRPAFPQTFDRPRVSGAAGLGCAELAEADGAWLRAVFALARARGLAELTLARNLGLFYLQGCQRTTRLYAAVAGLGGGPWIDFQQGNLWTDPLYWVGAEARLGTWDGQLSPAGQVLRSLIDGGS